MNSNLPSASEATVFVIDDDPQVVQSLSRLLRASGYRVCTYTSALNFLAEEHEEVPGCIVLDLSMPELSGLDFQIALLSTRKQRSIVFISGNGDIRSSVQAMKAGAVDFLMKPFDEEDLLTAVRVAIDKDRVERSARGRENEIRSKLATLTRREQQVLHNVVAGQLNKQIAAALGIAEKTVKVHRQRVMEKMQARTLAELVRISVASEAAAP
jgi:FixJ family two-component response regulator